MHHFFRNHDHDLLHHAGRVKMINELIEAIKHFKHVDHMIDDLTFALWERFGITPEFIEQYVEGVKKDLGQ